MVPLVQLGDFVRIEKGKKALQVFERPSATARRYLQIDDLRPDAKRKFVEPFACPVASKSDVVIAWDGANAGTVSCNLDGHIGSTLAVLRPSTQQLFAPYLSRFLEGKFDYLQKNSTGATVPHVSRDVLENLELPLPSLNEQQRIAGLLEQADRLRRTRRYALELSDSFLPAAFLELFGDLQSGPGMKTELSEVADMLTGYPFKSEEYVDEGETIRLCRGANVLPDRIDWNDLALWPKSKSHDLSEYLLQAGDVVIAMDRPWISEGFKVALIRPEHCPTLLVQRVTRLRGKNGVPNEFLYHLIRNPAFTRHCRPTETTIPHISPTEIKTFSFCVPPLALQQKFTALVERHERLRATQRETLRQAEHLFQALLHSAFNQELKGTV